MFSFRPQPDFRRFVDAVWRREPDRVPIAELGIDPPIKEQVLGKPIRDVKTDAEILVARRLRLHVPSSRL